MAGLNFVRVEDPRTNVNNALQRTYGVFSSGQSQIWQEFSQQNMSAGMISFVCTPPSERMFINRRIYIRCKWLLTFTGLAPIGVALLQAPGLRGSAGVNKGTSNYDAPRCYPISQACATITCTVGNDPIGTNLNTYSRIFQRFHRSPFEENGELSMSPSMPDQSLEYSDLDGFNLNPLNGYGDSTTQVPRGGFSDCLITRNDVSVDPLVPITATVELDCCEPTWMSPLNFSSTQESLSLVGIKNFNISLTTTGRGNGALAGLGGSLWSHSTNGNTLTAITAVPQSASAYFNFMTPDMTQEIPSVIPYSYTDVSLEPNEQKASLAAGASIRLTMSNTNQQEVPNCIYVWVDEQTPDFDVTKTDVPGFAITNINIQFNGQDGILSAATPYDLFQMSRKNGLNMSWEQFRYRCGAIVCVKFGADIALDSLSAAGLLQNTNLSMYVTCTNLRSRAVTPCLNVLIMSEGVMWITNGKVSRQLGLLDKETIYNAKMSPSIPYSPSQNVFGAGFFSDAWTGLKSFLSHAVRPAVNALKAVAPGPVSQFADEVATSYGKGTSGGGRMIGGKLLLK